MCLYNLMQRQLPTTLRYEKSIHITQHTAKAAAVTHSNAEYTKHKHTHAYTHTHTLSMGAGGAACSLIAKYKLFTKTSSDSLHLEREACHVLL